MPDLNDKEVLAQRDAWYAKARAKDMTLETLPGFLSELAAFAHDYNTIVYAVAAGAVATSWALDRSPNGGITGFQAGAVMWEFMEAWNDITAPAWLLQGRDLLCPQYGYKFNSIGPETWKWAQEEAGKKLTDRMCSVDMGEVQFAAHPDVVAHWQSLQAGVIPFGLTVRER